MIDIESLSFHDVSILGINFITEKDYFDKIFLFLESEDFIENFGTTKVTMVFRECYKANLALQMWIGGNDSIRELRLLDSSNELEQVNLMKGKGFIKNSDIFKHCEIVLNTSSSKIDILAKEISLVKSD